MDDQAPQPHVQLPSRKPVGANLRQPVRHGFLGARAAQQRTYAGMMIGTPESLRSLRAISIRGNAVELATLKVAVIALNESEQRVTNFTSRESLPVLLQVVEAFVDLRAFAALGQGRHRFRY
jgi:hypothetical protein